MKFRESPNSLLCKLCLNNKLLINNFTNDDNFLIKKCESTYFDKLLLKM